MLSAKLIELNFRLNDRGVVVALIFPEVKCRIQDDNMMNTYRALQIWKREIRSHARATCAIKNKGLARCQPSDENKTRAASVCWSS